MNDRDLTDRDQAQDDQANGDNWDVFADAMDLTIEGHRLIAEEIIFEVKLLWRRTASWLSGLPGTTTRRRSFPRF